MKEIKLIIYSENDTEDEFKFYSLDNLFHFINELTVERLMDHKCTRLEYSICVMEG